jgi:hypothetical protein
MYFPRSLPSANKLVHAVNGEAIAAAYTYW